MPHRLRKLHVIANQHSDFRPRRVNHLQRVAARNSPPFPFARRDMQLPLPHHFPIRQTNETRIINLFPHLHRMASRNDRHPKPNRQIPHQIPEIIRQFRELLDSLLRRQRVTLRKQLHREKLRQQHEIRPVIRRHAHEIRYLTGEILERFHLPHLVLHASDPDLPVHIGRRHVFRIQPFQKRRVIMTRRIVQIIRQNPPHLESFPQLKTQHLIPNLPLDHALRILLRRITIRVRMVIKQPPARYDPPQIQPLTKPPPRLIQRRPHAFSPRLRMHIHVRTVKRVRRRIVIRKITAIRNPVKSMQPQRIRSQIHNQRRNRPHNFVIDQRHHLPLRKHPDMTQQLFPAPNHPLRRQIRISRPVQLHQILDVSPSHLAHPNRLLFSPFSRHPINLTEIPAPFKPASKEPNPSTHPAKNPPARVAPFQRRHQTIRSQRPPP